VCTPWSAALTEEHTKNKVPRATYGPEDGSRDRRMEKTTLRGTSRYVLQITENEMGTACGMYGGEEKCTEILNGTL
jgi:hypothetical protein